MNYFNILNSKEILIEYNQRNLKLYYHVVTIFWVPTRFQAYVPEDELFMFLRVNYLNGSALVYPQLDAAFPLQKEDTNTTQFYLA